MNAPFANIFLALQQYISTGLPAIRHIDQDLGQLRAAQPPVSWPCLLIDFEEFSFENLGENVQTSKGTIVFRLGFAPRSNSSQQTPATYIKQAIGFYDVEWSLHKLLQGWSPGDTFGSLVRISTATQKRTDSYRVRELRYTLAFDDYSTKTQQQTAPATLIVNEDILL